MQGAFANKELRELTKVAPCVTHAAEMALTAADKEEMGASRAVKRKMAILQKV